MRQDLRQEPYAVTPPVRIRAGGGGQPSSLPHPKYVEAPSLSRLPAASYDMPVKRLLLPAI